MTTEGALLKELVDLLNKQVLIIGDETTIRDMFTRYRNPPFTLHSRAAIRMTVNSMNQFRQILQRANEHLSSEAAKEKTA